MPYAKAAGKKSLYRVFQRVLFRGSAVKNFDETPRSLHRTASKIVDVIAVVANPTMAKPPFDGGPAPAVTCATYLRPVADGTADMISTQASAEPTPIASAPAHFVSFKTATISS